MAGNAHRRTTKPPERRSSRAPSPKLGVSAPTPFMELRATLPLQGRPVVVAEDDRLLRMSIDERSGFLLSFCDGETTIQTILDICCIEESEAVALLLNLLRRGAIRVN